MSGREALRPVACACPQRVDGPSPKPDACAVIVAGGRGERFGDPRGKQFVELRGLPLACWSLLAFDRAPSVGHIVVVCASERMGQVRDEVLGRVSLRCDVSLAAAGQTRQQSVLSGLDGVPDRFDLVAIHDAARPLVSTASVEEVLAALRQDPGLDGAICATRATDTLKLAEDGIIVATPDRSFYWMAQTPQAFRRRGILMAHKAAVWGGYEGTDDASLVERRGGRVLCVQASRDNLKVTLPEDLATAEALLERRLMLEGCGLGE